jgi:hypothetical protein
MAPDDDDEDAMLRLVEQDPKAMRLASERLRSDEHFVCQAMQRHPYAYRYAAHAVRNNLATARWAVTEDWRLLQYVPAGGVLVDAARIALAHDVYALEHAPEVVRDDKSDVLPLVKKNGRVLRHASDRLRDDSEVVHAAVRSTGEAYLFASARLKEDAKIAAAAVRSCEVIAYDPERWKKPRFAVVAAARAPQVIRHLPWETHAASLRALVRYRPSLLRLVRAPTRELVEAALASNATSAWPARPARRDVAAGPKARNGWGKKLSCL